MNEAVIVLNAGSSSLKFSIYEVVGSELRPVARGQVEGLGTSPRFKAKDQQGQSLADDPLISASSQIGHSQAFAHLADWALKHYGERLRTIAVGHRIVHGGAEFIGPTLITEDVLRKLEQLVPIMPLHQPHNLAGVRAVTQLRPELLQVACFDTAFHRTKPKVAERFGLPDEMFLNGVRRWGFHGLSYESIANQFHQVAPEIAAGRVIVAHLGNGVSLCAMEDGQSVDTTMSFSALDGPPMGTRCGTVDPGVILFLLRQGWDLEQIEELLYRQSGLLGISRVSSDMRELLASGEPLAAEAIDFFVYRIVREIGSLAAVLGGLDALIFTGGIGENSPAIRKKVCERLFWLGIEIDDSVNERGAGRISSDSDAPSVWGIATDEEKVIAVHTLAVVRAMNEQAEAPKPVLAAPVSR